MKSHVYGIYDRDNTIRYVGKTWYAPGTRFAVHLRNAHRPHLRHLPISCWLRVRADEARLVELESGEWSDAELDDRERAWIEFFGLDNLLNVLPGGEGGNTSDARWAQQSGEMRTRDAQHRLAKRRGECHITGAPQPGCGLCSGQLSFSTLQSRGLAKLV